MSKNSPIRDEDNWFIGEDKIFRFDVTDGLPVAGRPKGTPVSMNGWLLEWVLRSSPEGDVLLTKTSAAGEILLSDSDPSDGIDSDRADVIILDTDTFNGSILISPGYYFYTLKRINEGSEQVLAFGNARLKLAATR